jgi:hypothetical protein
LKKRTKKLSFLSPGGDREPMDESLFASFSTEKAESSFLLTALHG